MKKSKIIVPALGVLLLSTAASISGTVAWFTANRSFSTSAGSFAVVKTNANLDAVVTAGLATKVVEGGNPVVQFAPASGTDVHELTDASFDHKTATHDIYAPNADGSAVAKKVALANATADSVAATGIQRDQYVVGTAPAVTHKVFSVATWTIAFSTTFTGAQRNYALYLDGLESRVTKVGDGSLTTGNGFRIAFVDNGDNEGNAQTGINPRVWADNRVATGVKHVEDVAVNHYLANEGDLIRVTDGDDTGKVFKLVSGAWVEQTVETVADETARDALDKSAYASKYVYVTALTKYFIGGTAWTEVAPQAVTNAVKEKAAGTQTAATELIASGDNLAAPASAADATSNYCLAKFDFAANQTVTKYITCVAWYEGTDIDIINRASTTEYDTVKADMKFTLVPLTA